MCRCCTPRTTPTRRRGRRCTAPRWCGPRHRSPTSRPPSRPPTARRGGAGGGGGADRCRRRTRPGLTARRDRRCGVVARRWLRPGRLLGGVLVVPAAQVLALPRRAVPLRRRRQPAAAELLDLRRAGHAAAGGCGAARARQRLTITWLGPARGRLPHGSARDTLTRKPRVALLACDAAVTACRSTAAHGTTCVLIIRQAQVRPLPAPPAGLGV